MAINIYLDDERPTPKDFIRTYTVEETIKLIEENDVFILSLDNDLGFPGQPDKEGYQVVRWLEERHHPNNPNRVPMKRCPENIVPHSANPRAVKDMLAGIKNLERWQQEEENE